MSCWSMFLAALVTALAVHLPWALLRFSHLSQDIAPSAKLLHKEYFYNEITGEVQWVDPGDTPFEDDAGNRFWIDKNNQRLSYNPNESQYVWLEQYSEDAKRPFFYNQETKTSTWDRPPDLAWRRIKLA